jgi:hypothetical protein
VTPPSAMSKSVLSRGNLTQATHVVNEGHDHITPSN